MKDTRQLILEEAMKLFSEKTYEQVTYSELEGKTGLTRGAILYYFKNKEELFRTVCDEFLLNDSSSILELLKVPKSITLLDFIYLYISKLSDMKLKNKRFGIRNINKALVNITNQATFYYPNFEIEALKWQLRQIHIWQDILDRAVYTSEIISEIDTSLLAELFEDICCGISYSGIAYPDGIDVKRLEKSFLLLYNRIKKHENK